jgi:hypothetical protein
MIVSAPCASTTGTHASAPRFCAISHTSRSRCATPTTVLSSLQRRPEVSTGRFASAVVFPPVYRTKRLRDGSTQHADINRKPREILDAAVVAAGGSSASPGKVIANLSFGFWRYLSSKAHEKTLWVPYLHTAFSAKTNRVDIDSRVGRLHGLRNRVAHHEPLLSSNVVASLEDLLWVVERVDPSIAGYISASSDVRALDGNRP